MSCIPSGLKMIFVKDYELLIKLFFLSGVCPFVVNKSNHNVQYTFWTIFYEITYIIAILIPTFVFGFYTYIVYFHYRNFLQSIFGIVISTEHLCIILSFLSTFCTTMFNIKSRMSVINGLNEIDDQIKSVSAKVFVYNSDFVNDKKRSLYSKKIITEFSFTLIYFTLIVYQYLRYANGQIVIIIYSIFIGWMLITTFFATMFIREIAQSIVLRFEKYKILLNGSILQQNFEQNFLYLFELFDKFYNIKLEINKSFGTQVLINMISDFIMETLSIFTLIIMTVYNDISFTFDDFGYVGIILVPFIVKNILFIQVMEKIHIQVNL